MPANVSYNSIATIFGFGNISSNTITSSMVLELIDRAGYMINKELGAETNGDDYHQFQSSDSSGSSYVDSNTLSIIQRAHAHLTCAYLFSLEYCPDLDAYSEVNGELIRYRRDFKNNTKSDYYLKEYNSILEMLMATDHADDYFNRHRNNRRGFILAKPTEHIYPSGNPL